MPFDEWGPFQDAFAEIFFAMKGDPEMALFIQGAPGDELSTVFITDRNAQLVERLCAGGWEDSDKPSGKHVSLLVGNGDPARKFGIELGPH